MTGLDRTKEYPKKVKEKVCGVVVVSVFSLTCGMSLLCWQCIGGIRITDPLTMRNVGDYYKTGCSLRAISGRWLSEVVMDVSNHPCSLTMWEVDHSLYPRELKQTDCRVGVLSESCMCGL